MKTKAIAFTLLFLYSQIVRTQVQVFIANHYFLVNDKKFFEVSISVPEVELGSEFSLPLNRELIMYKDFLDLDLPCKGTGCDDIGEKVDDDSDLLFILYSKDQDSIIEVALVTNIDPYDLTKDTSFLFPLEDMFGIFKMTINDETSEIKFDTMAGWVDEDIPNFFEQVGNFANIKTIQFKVKEEEFQVSPAEFEIILKKDESEYKPIRRTSL